jgi:hypothetical protein
MIATLATGLTDPIVTVSSPDGHGAGKSAGNPTEMLKLKTENTAEFIDA